MFSYDNNLKLLSYGTFDDPDEIEIYPKDFESKEVVQDIIKKYNKNNKDDKIVYTDMIGILLKSVTSIVNVISYILIAFVSVSLVVSSIMISIITYISVLERTKEIGILRAIGASKKDVSRVFNAETIIEGLKHIILGSKVLIFGSELNLISESILAFLYLLFPFKYPFQIISYLNKDNYNILESISPFIIGINEPYYDNFFIDKEIAIDGMEIFVIDLDKKTSFELFYETFPNFKSTTVYVYDGMGLQLCK
jgi:hypothetical protein